MSKTSMGVAAVTPRKGRRAARVIGRAMVGSTTRLALAALLLLANPAAVGAAAPADESSVGDRADEIIVTAQRREEPIRNVPISLTALDAHRLERLGAETIEDVARAVPNFTIAPTGILGVGQAAIRGVYSPAGSATVSLYVDDVPIQIRSLGFAGNADLRLFDIDRVEVLRGPQGTLFGANSMGGTVRFITRKPDLDSPGSYAATELTTTRSGDFSYEAQGAVGAALIPGGLGLRASAYYRMDAGYVDRFDHATQRIRSRNVNDVGAVGLRLGLRAAPTDRIEILPSLLYQRTRRDDYPFFQSDLGPHRQAYVHRQPGEDEFVLPSATVRFELGGAEVTSVMAYLDRRNRQTTDYSRVFGELVLGGAVPGLVPEGGARSFSDVIQRSVTQEVRLTSTRPDAQFKWVLGIFYQDARVRLSQAVVEPGIEQLVRDYIGLPVEAAFGVPLLPGGISYRGFEDVSAEQFAGFGEVTWRISDRVEATAGLRVSHSDLKLEVLSEGPYAGGTATVPANGRQRETPITPRFALSYRPSPELLLYASSSKGFRIGGANPPVPAGPCAQDLRALGLESAPVAFNSDQLWSHEAGAKASFARGALNASLALFQIDWDGIQQLVSLPTCGFSYVDNLGAARNRGLELEIEARPQPNLLLTTAIGFVDARFRETIAVGGTGGEGTATIVEEGDRVPYTPRWSVRVAAEYGAPLNPRLRAYARAEYQYASAYRRAPSRRAVGYNPLVYHGDAYGNALLRAGLESGNWETSIFAENVFDDRSVLFNSADFVPATGSPLRQTTLRPRTIGIAGLVRF